MVKRMITKKMLKNNPYEKWNQFIELIALEDYCELTEIQKIAHLCFRYDSEIQNGGHLQYFANKGLEFAFETLHSLKVLGAHQQAEIFENAIHIMETNGFPKIETVEEYVHEAQEGKFDEIDRGYNNCSTSITNLLQEYLQKYENEFFPMKMYKSLLMISD